MRSGVMPVVRRGKRLKLVLDEKLKRLIVVIAGEDAHEACKIKSERFPTDAKAVILASLLDEAILVRSWGG